MGWHLFDFAEQDSISRQIWFPLASWFTDLPDKVAIRININSCPYGGINLVPYCIGVQFGMKKSTYQCSTPFNLNRKLYAGGKNMRNKNKLMAAVVVLLSVAITSCAAVVAGGAGAAAAYTYAAGWLDRDYQATMDATYQAALDALKESNIEIVEENRDVAKATIRAESPDQTYWVRLESKGEELTNVSIRAGLMGNEAASQQIHRNIEGQL